MNKQYTINGKVVGVLKEETYFTTRTSTIHYFVKGRGYPISENILNHLAENGCRKIRIKEIGVKGIKYYECEFMDYFTAWVFQEGDYDKQRCYPLDKMRVVE